MSFRTELIALDRYARAAARQLSAVTVQVTERYARRVLRLRKKDPTAYRGVPLLCIGSEVWRRRQARHESTTDQLTGRQPVSHGIPVAVLEAVRNGNGPAGRPKREGAAGGCSGGGLVRLPESESSPRDSTDRPSPALDQVGERCRAAEAAPVGEISAGHPDTSRGEHGRD